MSQLDFQNLHEIVAAARQALDRNMWDYVVGGAETETTVKRNRLALDRIGFRPRVLRDVSTIDTAGDFLGRKIRLPLIVAPVGGLEAMYPQGGAVVARAAGHFGVPFFLSSVNDLGLERVADAATGPKVYQLYVRGDQRSIDEDARRAIDKGYDAFCFTVDTAVYSRRERDLANRFDKPWRRGGAGIEWQARLAWSDIARFRDKHKIKLIIKGIATPEDAETACRHAIDVVYVSNHGGRQLDQGCGTMDLLPEIVAAVAGRARIIVDGGICRGTDIAKALALGADLVGIGRLYCYGMAAAGEAGIVRVLELLENELVSCLGLLGVTAVAELDTTYLRPAEPVVPPSVLSAFPLLD
jgi:glycolate oxidase